MNATEAGALQAGQRIQWSDHHIDEVIANDTAGQTVKVKRGPGYVEMKTPPPLPPRKPQPVEQNFSYAALLDANLVFANTSLTEDAPADGRFYARDGKNGKWMDVSGGVAPPTIDAGRGLTMNGSTIDLDPATETEIGGMTEAPSDGTPYVRQDAAWEPAAAGAALDFGVGLELTGTTVDLQPATPTPGEIGGINEPTPDDVVVYARKYDTAGVASWEPISVTGITIADDPPMTPAPIHGQLWYESDTGNTFIWYVDASSAQWVQIAPGEDGGPDGLPIFYGIGLTRTGLTVNLDPATDVDLGGIFDPPPDDLMYVRQRTAAGVSSWIVIPPGTTYIWGVGLEETTPGTIDLQPANTNGEIGGVIVVARGPTQGLEYDLSTGTVWAPLATPDLAGTITEPIADDKGYVRRTDLAGNSQWVPPALPPGSRPAGDEVDERGVVYVPDAMGLALQEDGRLTIAPTTPSQVGGITDAPYSTDPANPTPYMRQDGDWVESTAERVVVAGDNENQKGIVYVPDAMGLALGEDGRLTLAPTTPSQVGGIVDAPFSDPADPIGYVRQNADWVESTSALTFRYGLEQNGSSVDVTPATGGDQAGAPELGGVYGTKRSDRNGLVIDPQGHISAPLATPDLAGTILEPIADDKGYVRTTHLDGTSEWVPPALPPSFMTVGRSPTQALDEGIDPVLNMRLLWVPLATDKLAGAIVEPPADGLQYARSNDIMTGAQWVPSATAGVFVGDSPPPTPEPNQLWFESDTGNLFLYYVDADSSQFIQVNIASAPITGVEEAPTDGQPYVRQSAAWVADTGGGGIADAPEDGQLYARKDKVWEVVPPDTVGLVDAPNNTNLYARKGAAWSVVPAAGISQATADARYLKLTGGTITGRLTIKDGIYQYITSNSSFWTYMWAQDAINILWLTMYNDTDYYFMAGIPGQPTNWDNVYTINRASRVMNFAVRPTVAGVPIVTLAEHQNALDRIDELERRLVTLERRLS